jgi:hypothetical protein
MFDFLKPEVSGMKNVLNGYFAFKNQCGVIGDVPPEHMESFADWYFSVRLGPPLVTPSNAASMQAIAHATLRGRRSNHITLVDVLLALLAAEGMGDRNPNCVAIGKVFDKFPSISPAIRGI